MKGRKSCQIICNIYKTRLNKMRTSDNLTNISRKAIDFGCAGCYNRNIKRIQSFGLLLQSSGQNQII